MERALRNFFCLLLGALVAACAAGQPLPSPTPGATSTPTSQTGPTMVASTWTPTPANGSSVAPGAFPAELLNMPVITVAAANAAVASGALDGRFAAVGGYWRQYALPCPFLPHQPIIEGFCSGSVFADSPQDENAGGGIGGSAPVSAPETVNGDQLWSAASESPAPVVLIVHAGDSRAWQCTPDQLTDCQRHMVIDAVVWVNGTFLAPLSLGIAYDATPTMSLGSVASIATASGGQLVTAYALDAAHLNDLDPRLLGMGKGTVWYVRVAQPASGSDITAAGTVRLINDADGSLIDDLPLSVAADYSPARLVLDSQNSGSGYPHFTVDAGATVLADDQLDLSTTPIALLPGEYVLHAYMTDQNGVAAGGASCDKSITAAATDNLAYTANFSSSTCSWGPGNSSF
jgi:hypothetical protein